MRSAVVFQLVSGQAWFTAGAFVLVVLALDLAGTLRRKPALRVVARLTFLLAIGIGALSGTPVPLWLLVPLALATVGVVATGFRPEASRAARIAEAALIALVAAALALEVPRHREPSFDLPRNILILGDSLSSGGFDEETAWPERLAAQLGVPVISLAAPGETVALALANQASELGNAQPGSVMLIELGGNDLLGGTSVKQFERDLDALLSATRRSAADRVVMFELPIPPGRWRWAATQREIARRHGVTMIPKRVLARLVTTPHLVEDGLHPTDAGHQYLAREVAKLFGSRGRGV